MRIRRSRGQRPHGLVRTYVWFMVVCVAASVTAAVMLTMSRTSYEAYSSVVVRPTITSSGSILGASMPTEQEMAQSGFVVRRAAAQLGVPAEVAQENVTIEVPVDAAVLNFTYTAATARDAFVGAKAFSEAYVEYRNDGEEPPIARLITPASLPNEPVAHDYALIVGVAIVGGLALGFAAALGWDRIAGRLRTVEDAGVRTGLPVLASLPHMSRQQRTRSVLTGDPQMTTAFAQLASRVPGLVESRKEFVVLLTGATPHAGTSTIAHETASALARMGKPVVLVGADPDSTAVEETFGIPRSPGLSDLLAGRAVPDEALHETAVPGLRVLPPGSDNRGSTPQSLDDLQLLIWSLAADSIVIIDAPAVLSSAHAALLGYIADRVVLVVDLAHGSRSSAREAAACLTHVADKVVGCVTNQPDRVPRRTFARSGITPPTEMVTPNA